MSRTALTAFAEKHGIPVNASNKHYSMDRNMLHCSLNYTYIYSKIRGKNPARTAM